MKRREMARQLHIKDVIIEHWRNECLRLMRELTNLSQMKIERIPGEKEFAAMQAALNEISGRNDELIRKVADLTAENERIKKERDEALEKELDAKSYEIRRLREFIETCKKMCVVRRCDELEMIGEEAKNDE